MSLVRRRRRLPPAPDPPDALRLPLALALAALGARRVPRGLRAPGAVELPGSRPRRARAERRTLMLGLVALGTTGAVLGGELARVWRRGSAAPPRETDHVMGGGEEGGRPAGG